MNAPKVDVKAHAETLPETPKPELAAGSENADIRAQELLPGYVQEIDSRNVQELSVIVVHELPISSSPDTVPIKYDKPLPGPPELEKSRVCEELERDASSP
ncbi:MAG: hypothetical protein Q9170_007817 [Blastenia crenularia]